MTPRSALAIAALVATACLPIPARAAGPGPLPAQADSCVACHRDASFLVKHPKLYDYYRDWDRSIHRAEGVGCADCHGGNSGAAEKNAAHAVSLGEDTDRSAVNFANVPDTCGSCHKRIRDAYFESSHYAYLEEEEEEEEKQGPNCVTCHRAMNTLILDVTTVEATCSQCHNEDTENEPDMPEKARHVLNKFLSIDRFHRYVAARLEPAEAAPFLAQVDGRIEELSVQWHSFEIDDIEERTIEVLDILRAKRDEIRARSAKPADAAKPESGELGDPTPEVTAPGGPDDLRPAHRAPVPRPSA